ncbi:MAG TPA: Holliday junction branch migration protein RuvA [Stellaceae bacterium]|nr:Holliday junction branch migration protein RuvA [Stellaceae bacterium]
MIARLTGRLDEIAADGIVIDVGGVGYLVHTSARTAARLPEPGAAVRLVIETHVREDAINLYGFLDGAERDWFRLLTTVQGVGAKVALAILGVLDPGGLAKAIFAQDKAALARADGVGPKLAARITNELRDKAAGLPTGAPASLGGVLAASGAASDVDGPIGEAVSALVNLGYRRAEALGAVSVAAKQLGSTAKVEQLIVSGLNEMAR